MALWSKLVKASTYRCSILKYSTAIRIRTLNNLRFPGKVVSVSMHYLRRSSITALDTRARLQH